MLRRHKTPRTFIFFLKTHGLELIQMSSNECKLLSIFKFIFLFFLCKIIFAWDFSCRIDICRNGHLEKWCQETNLDRNKNTQTYVKGHKCFYIVAKHQWLKDSERMELLIILAIIIITGLFPHCVSVDFDWRC